jgi:amino acid transporter
LLGIIITVLILLVYMVTCIAVPFFYLREHREEFSILRHVVLPLVPAIILLFPIGAQFYPAPQFPYNLAAPICIGWLVLGVIIVVFLRLRAPQALAQGDKIFVDE